ncbi:MAG: hypothetical protein JXQ71_06190 [Verrucomicrobia bacterium]|nr:hypothetical protein [Verrucomicrobiota bacterium]
MTNEFGQRAFHFPGCHVWSRYQAHIALFSPIHFDTPAQSIPPSEWSRAAKAALDQFGPPPFGTLVGNNANPSSLCNWGHVNRAPWLGFHPLLVEGRGRQPRHGLAVLGESVPIPTLEIAILIVAVIPAIEIHTGDQRRDAGRTVEAESESFAA